MTETVVLIAILIIALVVLAAVLFNSFRRADTSALDQAMKAFEDEMRSEFRNQRVGNVPAIQPVARRAEQWAIRV